MAFQFAAKLVECTQKVNRDGVIKHDVRIADQDGIQTEFKGLRDLDMDWLKGGSYKGSPLPVLVHFDLVTEGAGFGAMLRYTLKPTSITSTKAAA